MQALSVYDGYQMGSSFDGARVALGLLTALSIFLLGAPRAGATIATKVATFPGFGQVVVPAASSAGTLTLAQTSGPQSSYLYPNELFALTPSAAPVSLTGPGYVAKTALSSNGRYAAWVVGPCSSSGFAPTRADRVYVLDAASGTTPHELTLPSRYAAAGFGALSISASGSITALVSTYNYNILCAGRQRSPRDTEAVLTAAPGAARLTVLASVPTYIGMASVTSPDSNTYALCSAIGPDSRTAELISVSVGDQPRLRRVSMRRSQRDTSGVACGAANSGAAAMMFEPSNTSYDRLITLGDGVVHSVRLPAKAPWYGPILSPSGREALVWPTEGEAGVVNLASGRFTDIPLATSLRRLKADPFAHQAGQGLDWVDAHTIIGATDASNGCKGVYLFTLDPTTRRWSTLRRVSQCDNGSQYCPLPSGRILVAELLPQPNAANIDKFYLFNAAGAGFESIQTGRLGIIHDVSCDPGDGQVYLSVGTSPAALYSVAASAIDGSPWTP
jgi:hypothetical protein